MADEQPEASGQHDVHAAPTAAATGGAASDLASSAAAASTALPGNQSLASEPTTGGVEADTALDADEQGRLGAEGGAPATPAAAAALPGAPTYALEPAPEATLAAIAAPFADCSCSMRARSSQRLPA